MGLEQHLKIVIGETFEYTVRWETLPVQFLPITGLTNGAPAVVTSSGHGLKTGWRVAFESVGGMWQINAQNTPPKRADYDTITVIDANTFSVDGLNTLNYSAYTSGGVAVCNTPQSISGYTAELILSAIGGAVLFSTTSPTDITVDDTNHLIAIAIPASVTENLAVGNGTYILWLTSGAGVATELMSGTFNVAAI